jgi:putative tricarboxylic transport membrane protein
MQTLWTPDAPLEIVAGTPPGGGLDRTARAILKTIEAEHLLDVQIEVKNVPGDGARKAWTYMDERRGDPHVVSISHPNLTTDKLVGIASFDHRAYTPIAVLYTEYIAFAVRTDSALRTGDDVLERLRDDANGFTVALSTALGNPNHIALAQLALHTGADPNAPLVRVFDSALDAVADVVAGNAEIAAVTAASTFPAVQAGDIRVIGISAPQRLAGTFADVPTWRELGVDCVIGAWRGVTGASGIGESHVAFWQRTLERAAATATWAAELERNGWSASYVSGAALHDFLERERTDMAAALKRLGLLRAAAA